MNELDRLLMWKNHAKYVLEEMNKEILLGFPEGKHSASVLFDDYCEALEELGEPIPEKPDWYNRLWRP